MVYSWWNRDQNVDMIRYQIDYFNRTFFLRSLILNSVTKTGPQFLVATFSIVRWDSNNKVLTFLFGMI
jgi:hypothetical protein